VNNRDGTDSLKHVEFLQFADATVNVENGAQWHYVVNGEVDETGQKPGTEDVINGGGNSALGYNLARNEDAGIELGMQIKYSRGPSRANCLSYGRERLRRWRAALSDQ
jgi:hypothetical protein